MSAISRIILLSALLLHLNTRAVAALQRNAFRATFPIEILLKDTHTDQPLDRPVGIVAGLDTTMYVASASGQLMLVDIKAGTASILNPGGDDQPFGGLCLDSRGPGTVYATGRQSGAVFAFNRRGELLRRFQLTTTKSKGGTSDLVGCIQTRYQLLITDSNNARFYYLPLKDDGPRRGHPPALVRAPFQGKRVQYQGDQWQQNAGVINAYGVEWAHKFNETGYVLNSATGKIYTMTVKKDSVIPNMREVSVSGRVDTFKGALGILFDSTNENVMYITMPHLNAIAVLEFSRKHPRIAKFIRYLNSALTDGPIAVGEYGNWIYPISGNFRSATANGVYSIVQMPKHEQVFEGEHSDDEFTSTMDDVDEEPLAVLIDPADVQNEVRAEPSPIGTSAPEPIVPPNSELPLDTSAPGDSSSDDDGDDSDSDSGTGDVTSQISPTVTPSVPSTDSTGPREPSKTPSTFGAAADQDAPQGSDGGRECFPAAATVTLEDGSAKRMDALHVGDSVLVSTNEQGGPVYSHIFMFSHQDRSTISSFVSIETSHGQTLQVSPGHFVYIDGRLSPAREVRVGDVLTSHVGREQVIRARSVSTLRARGLYNPQTIHGDLVVNGVQVSTYTTAVKPVAATALMAPIRAAYACRTRWPHRISLLLARGVPTFRFVW
ncbi:Desert hedgehog protein B [Gracilariopsis chorda]|uniref:Desert hedgehog protein B n=1 Tax=Gracilariopsis chorda TaxID=448386 RepID=A0A2V3INZ3_9FLOR|nr:Desert hedgehog protein B [Gracilariopsis chorda]|eukprot:PXF43792.1 Desert hedgehog protein B [Gracilariopsis chorda]